MVEGGAAVLPHVPSAKAWPTRCGWPSTPRLRLGAAGGAEVRFDAAPSRALPHTCDSSAAWRSRPTRCIPTRLPQTCVYLTQAVDEGRKCTPARRPTASARSWPRPTAGSLQGSRTKPPPTHHAEQEAIAKALAAVRRAPRRRHCTPRWSPARSRASEPERLHAAPADQHTVSPAPPSRSTSPAASSAAAVRSPCAKRAVDVRAYPTLAGGVWEANAHLKR